MGKGLYDRFRYIPNDDNQKYPLCMLKLSVTSFDTSSLTNESKFDEKYSKIIQENLRTFYKTLGTGLISRTFC